jgi:hypothetical protein
MNIVISKSQSFDEGTCGPQNGNPISRCGINIVYIRDSPPRLTKVVTNKIIVQLTTLLSI